MVKPDHIAPEVHWVSDPQYAKAKFQFRAHVNEVLRVFDMYGMGIEIPGALEQIWRLTEDFSLRVRGVDKPIDINLIRGKLRWRD